MNEILYGYSELLIVAGLLVSLFIAVDLVASCTGGSDGRRSPT